MGVTTLSHTYLRMSLALFSVSPFQQSPFASSSFAGFSLACKYRTKNESNAHNNVVANNN